MQWPSLLILQPGLLEECLEKIEKRHRRFCCNFFLDENVVQFLFCFLWRERESSKDNSFTFFLFLGGRTSTFILFSYNFLKKEYLCKYFEKISIRDFEITTVENNNNFEN